MGKSLAILVLVALLIAVVVVLPIINSNNRRAAQTAALESLRQARFAAEPEALVQSLQLRLAGLKNTLVSQSGPNTLLLQRSHFPTWTIVVSILFFPLGLLALLAKRTETATLVVRSSPQGTSIEFGGRLSSLVQSINRAVSPGVARVP